MKLRHTFDAGSELPVQKNNSGKFHRVRHSPGFHPSPGACPRPYLIEPENKFRSIGGIKFDVRTYLEFYQEIHRENVQSTLIITISCS